MIRKIGYLLLIMGILILKSTGYSATHQEVFDKNYLITIVKIKYSTFPGPISKELAKVALARQILEDGPNRKPGESVAGISTGGINKDIVNNTIPKHISIGYVGDGSGTNFYHFKGFGANIYSALVISKLYDHYIINYIKSDRKNWLLSKEISKAIQQNPDSLELNMYFYNKLNPIKMIEKADAFYGPQHKSVKNIYSAFN